MFEEIKFFIIDMDGTFYLSDTLLKGAREFIRRIEQTGRDYCFFTNNSSHDASECAEKLKKLGFDADRKKIVISSHVAIDYIKRKRPNSKIYLLGNEKFTNDCIGSGLELTDEEPDAVLLGFDTTLTYEKITKAANLIAEGKEYFATHPDKNCPLADGFMTDAGSFIEMLYASAGRYPDKIFGKPYKYTVEYLTHKLSCTRESLCFIGDRLETDIAIARNTGVKSVLVFSGVTTREMYASSDIKATLTADGLYELVDML